MRFWDTHLYPRLPVAAQNAAISAYGFWWRNRRFGGIFEQEFKGLKEREGFTAPQWRAYQTQKLRSLLVHAFETVPLYQERFRSCGLTSSRLRRFELEDLRKLPHLTKDDLRRYGTSRLLSSKREPGGAFFGSSGSTGTPVRILYSHAFHQRLNAVMEARVRHWAGLTRHDARGMIGGRRIVPTAHGTPPFHRYNRFEKQTYFSAYHISPAHAADYLDGIRSNGVRYMTGYAMSNYLLASCFDQAGLRPPRMKAVVTSSEKLTPRMRDLFEKVYGCRAFDSYSGVENCGFASECPEGAMLVSPDVGIFEVLDDQGEPVAPGEEGDVVCTGFLNVDQPLIRYRIGDRARTAGEDAPTGGRGMPALLEIAGRVEDTIVTPDGRKMVRFHGIFVNLPNVVEGQVIQHREASFTVKVVVRAGFDAQEEEVIRKRMRSQLGEGAQVNVERTDRIPRTANGKFQAVISEFDG